MPGIRRAQSLGEQLAASLRLQIVNGELEPETHLVEDSLAEQNGVSRGPVRDAFRILSSEGLIVDRRRGFFVKPFTADDVDELYSLRYAIESLACSLAVSEADPKDWQDARAYVREMAAHADRKDWHGFAVSDLAFHGEFYRLSGHQRLQSLWAQYRPTFGALLEVTTAQDIDLRPSAEDHESLLVLAEGGRDTDLAAALQIHLEGSRNRMKNALGPVWKARSA